MLSGWAPLVGVWMSSSWWLGMVIEEGKEKASRSAVIVAVYPVLCVGSCSTPGLGRGRLISRRRRPTTTSEGSMTASRGTHQQTGISTFAFYL